MKKALNVSFIIIVTLFAVYLAFWAGVYHTQHIWVYSEIYHIKAFQLFVYVLLGAFWAGSPAWIMGLIIGLSRYFKLI